MLAHLSNEFSLIIEKDPTRTASNTPESDLTRPNSQENLAEEELVLTKKRTGTEDLEARGELIVTKKFCEQWD